MTEPAEPARLPPREIRRRREAAAADHHAVDLIRAKRDGQRLTDAQIRWLFDRYLTPGAGAVPDEQMSALLMAIYFQGLDTAELRTWTAAMIDSGERLDLSGVGRPTVDKHSTGGVGDKVSLILAPLVASCGAAVPQLSGRGLGHTGGTLDKLEAIRGWRSSLRNDEMRAVLQTAGCVICAAGPGLAPADRRLYALRDVTGTVESIPLIASSIMSKKIAEGTGALVLDVKVGSGAFMREEAQARLLAQTMVTLGAENGVATSALLTRMDTPLGRAVGNAVEVEEAVATLRGEGPAGPGRGDPGPGPRDAPAGRDRRGPGGGAGRRPRAGLLAGDGPRPGRRPGRAAARGPAHQGGAARAPRSAGCSGSTPGRSGWPPGGSAPGARSRRIRSARRPACAAWPSRASGSSAASRCWNC